MKTTIDIDENKLKHLMKATGLKTRKAAVDYALSEAERAARLKKLLSSGVRESDYKNAIDPAYDVLSLREKEVARKHVPR